MNDSMWFAGLWCRVCRLSPKRCTCYAKVDAPQYTRTMTMDDPRVPWPIKRMTRAEFEQQYVDDRPENQWPPGSLTTVPQYTRTMTMDDLRRNALESVIEELKERDA